MSSDEIFFDAVQYVSTSSAASLSNLTRDYIARLCREGKLVSRRVGKNWYISHPPLQSFLVEHAYSLDKQREELAQQRVMEYQAHVNSVKPSFDKTPESPKLKQIQNGSARSLFFPGGGFFCKKIFYKYTRTHSQCICVKKHVSTNWSWRCGFASCV